MIGLTNNSPLSVSAYPTIWRIEMVNDDIHRGWEYVRSEHAFARRTGTFADAAYQLLFGNHEDHLEYTKWYKHRG